MLTKTMTHGGLAYFHTTDVPEEHRDAVSALYIEASGEPLDVALYREHFPAVSWGYVLNSEGKAVFIRSFLLSRPLKTEGLSAIEAASVFQDSDVYTHESWRGEKIATHASTLMLDEFIPIWVPQLRAEGILPQAEEVFLRGGFEYPLWAAAFNKMLMGGNRPYTVTRNHRVLDIMTGFRGVEIVADEDQHGPCLVMFKYDDGGEAARKDDSHFIHMCDEDATEFFHGEAFRAAGLDPDTDVLTFEEGQRVWGEVRKLAAMFNLEWRDISHLSVEKAEKETGGLLKELATVGGYGFALEQPVRTQMVQGWRVAL